MSIQHKISLPVVRRLPKYYRYVNEMLQNGITKVSSSELAHMMGTTASQVRQDFNCFGGFGQQGIGYNTEVLHSEIEKLIFNNRHLNTILIGAGSLGQSIAKWIVSKDRGYQITAIFDINPTIIGKEICDCTVMPIDNLAEYCKNHKPQIAVLCIPKESAKAIAPTLLNSDIEGFWNFSHYDLSVDKPDVIVENVHLGDSLMTLAFLANSETD